MVPQPQTSIGLQPVDPRTAAEAFERLGVTDPEGLATPQSMAAAGQCFRLQNAKGQLFMSLGNERGVMWAYAVAGQGSGLYLDADAALCRIARLAGFQRVGFQTRRRGLVRRALSLGYRVTGPKGAGFALEKDLL